MIRQKSNFFTTSDNAMIYFEDYGEGAPILIIPGYLCTSKFFKRNIEALSENNRLILVDARGHGSSSKILTGLNIPRMAKDIKELVDFLGLERLTLLAWSMGSSIALSYYEQFGDYKLSRIGIIDSALYPFSHEASNCHSLRGYDMDGMNRVMNAAIKDFEGYCRNFARAIFKEEPSIEDESWVATEMMKTPPWIAFAIYSDFLHRDYVQVLKHIQIPTLICSANSPAIPSSDAMSQHYRKQLTVSHQYKHFESKAGHVMFYEAADEFNRMVLDFIQNT
jgi:pimeloyl-ACP methyl ester carboxylesterase